MPSWANADALTAKALESMPMVGNASPKLPREFWMKKGEEIKAIILDEAISFTLYRHTQYEPGNKAAGNAKVPCLAGGSTEPDYQKCPMCRAMMDKDTIKRSWVGYITIINVTGYTSKDGSKRTFVRQLVPLNQDTANHLLKLQEELASDGKSLRGQLLKVSRSHKDKSFSIGDSWLPLGKRVNPADAVKKADSWKSFHKFRVRAEKAEDAEEITPKSSFQLYISPFDYAEELEPTEERISYFIRTARLDPSRYGLGKKTAAATASDYVRVDEGEDFDDIDVAFDEANEESFGGSDSSDFGDGDMSEPYDGGEDDGPPWDE